ncbi:hypothetical protein NW814_06110 [Synechococcus sp. R65.1]|uniref:hypothetical protein n=1 Tax=unclassified Synechococcus TaxID=2626047 RepID=UPI0039C1C821
MITAELISAEEFRQIMEADLEACCEAFGLRAEYLRLEQQQLRLWVMLALCLLVIALVILLGVRDPGYWLLYAVAVLLLGVVFLGLLWALLKLRQNLRRIRQRWQEAHLLNSPAEIMEFASDLACRVKEYNRWVQELQQSLEGGHYWQDFRQLSEAEQKYIQSLFLQVRAQLVMALQVCRALIENPQTSVAQYLNQMVARDQQLVEQFVAKNLTANRYVTMARHLSALEAGLQARIGALASC